LSMSVVVVTSAAEPTPSMMPLAAIAAFWLDLVFSYFSESTPMRKLLTMSADCAARSACREL